jgi:ABC-type enterochelin transport system substrate-binding protein
LSSFGNDGVSKEDFDKLRNEVDGLSGLLDKQLSKMRDELD